MIAAGLQMTTAQQSNFPVPKAPYIFYKGQIWQASKAHTLS